MKHRGFQKTWLLFVYIYIFAKSCHGIPTIWQWEQEPGPISTEPSLNVHRYQNIVNKIIEQSTSGTGKHQSYDRLAEFTDKFSNRIAGSQNLENSIDYLIKEMKEEGFNDVHGENVSIKPWVRNNENAFMLKPRFQKLAMLGLGSSVPTPPSGITADVLVVQTFAELKEKAALAKNKIVVFNQDFISYGITVKYRTQGASEAAKVGALATLIRSVTPLSIYSPHTGHQTYESDVRKIPTACITVEDAQMFQRMQDRGEKITVKLFMNCTTLPERNSRNILAEITGSKKPEEVVLFGGHIDSWDVGKGAMDDGGGAFISWQVLSLIQQLGLRPTRTLRMIMWTGEEEGGIGGQAYFDAHKTDLAKFKFVMESDSGTFRPTGILYHGESQVGKIVKQVTDLLKSINATNFQEVPSPGSIGEDVTPWISAGVPGAALMNEGSRYFYYHHTDGDTMTVQDPHEMDLCAAVWAAVAYIMADLDWEVLRF